MILRGLFQCLVWTAKPSIRANFLQGTIKVFTKLPETITLYTRIAVYTRE